MIIKFAVKIASIQGHKCVSNLSTFLLAISRTVFKHFIQTCDDGKLMDAIYGHACFDDLDLDVRPQWVGKGKKISVECSRQLSKQ